MKTLKKKFPLILFYLFSGILLQAQHSHVHTPDESHSGCMTTPTAEQRAYRRQMITDDALRAFQASEANNRSAITYIPVRNITVTRSNGTGGLFRSQIRTAMSQLNTAYAPMNIQFYECSNTIVSNDTFYRIFRSQRAALATKAERPNVVNIFYVREYFAQDSSSRCGNASFPGLGGTDRIFIANGCALNGSTMAHELGHYFNVFHTHSRYNNPLALHSVDNNMCFNSGDEICDTPVDPGITLADVDSNCTYTGGASDSNGVAYAPLTNNYMGYGRNTCRNSFTAGQMAIIRYTAINLRAYLTCSTCTGLKFVENFNFGTDVNSHSYTASVNTSVTTTPQNCRFTDSLQVVVGNCNTTPPLGGDFVSVKFTVPVGTEKLAINLVGNSSDSMAVYVDDEFQHFATNSGNCNLFVPLINNISNHTQDGEVVIKFVDPVAGCSGDFRLDFMQLLVDDCGENLYAPLPYFTNFYSNNSLDQYWSTQSQNEFGRVQYIRQNGPYSPYHLIMDSNRDNFFSTNQSDLRIDASTCSSFGPILNFKWKDFQDEPEARDGVFLSDDGGINFVKVYDLVDTVKDDIWNYVTLDLSTLAAANNLSLTDKFIIRFQHNGRGQAPSNGIAIGHVHIYGCVNNFPSTSNNSNHTTSNLSDLQNLVNHTTTETANIAQVEVFPNPAHQHLNLNFKQFKTSEQVSIRLVNMLGATLYTTTHNINNVQSDLLQLNIEQLPTGVYSAIVEGNNKLLSNKRFVIQR